MLWEDFANRKLEEMGFPLKVLYKGFLPSKFKVLESWVVQSPKQVLRSRGINERDAGFVSAPMNPPGIHFNQASNSSKVGLQSEAKNVTASTIGIFCERCSEKVGG